MNKYIFILAFLLLPTLVAASTSDIYKPHEDAVIDALCVVNSIPTNSGANVSIFYPNNTIFINNTAMNLVSDDRYRYNFTAPETLGSYSVLVTCHDIGESISSFQVKEDEFLPLAEIVGFGALIVLFLSIGIHFLSKPVNIDPYVNIIKKLFNIKTLGLFIVLGTSWLLIPYAALLYEISDFAFFETLNWLLLIIIPFMNLLFFSLYIITLIYVEWGVKNTRYNG